MQSFMLKSYDIGLWGIPFCGRAEEGLKSWHCMFGWVRHGSFLWIQNEWNREPLLIQTWVCFFAKHLSLMSDFYIKCFRFVSFSFASYTDFGLELDKHTGIFVCVDQPWTQQGARRDSLVTNLIGEPDLLLKLNASSGQSSMKQNKSVNFSTLPRMRLS